ncbi:MAG: transposase [Stellaceae bacterium]
MCARSWRGCYRAESGGPRGYDAGKKIKGRKRHIVVDTQGNLLNVVIHPANVQDRDGARSVLDRPTRWIVDRTLAWISCNRRSARGFERYARSVAAFVRLAMIRIMCRRMTRPIHSA